MKMKPLEILAALVVVGVGGALIYAASKPSPAVGASKPTPIGVVPVFSPGGVQLPPIPGQ